MSPNCKTPVATGASRNSCGGYFRAPLSLPGVEAQFLDAMPDTQLSERATNHWYRGQRYVPLGVIPHTRRDGSQTWLRCWVSHCASCQRPFPFLMPAASAKFAPNRRCQHCKQPGVRVKGRPRHGGF